MFYSVIVRPKLCRCSRKSWNSKGGMEFAVFRFEFDVIGL